MGQILSSKLESLLGASPKALLGMKPARKGTAHWWFCAASSVHGQTLRLCSCSSSAQASLTLQLVST